MITVDTTGIDRLLAGVIAKALDRGADAAADFTVEQAKATVVVGEKSPHTMDTIQAQNSGPGIREIQAEEASIFIELGTSRMPARPFLLPAAMNSLEAFVDALKETLK